MLVIIFNECGCVIKVSLVLLYKNLVYNVHFVRFCSCSFQSIDYDVKNICITVLQFIVFLNTLSLNFFAQLSINDKYIFIFFMTILKIECRISGVLVIL